MTADNGFTADERLQRASDALRARSRAPGPEFVERVMGAVRGMDAPRRGMLAWVLEPRAVRVRPLWVPLAAAAAMAVWLLGRQSVRPVESPAIPAVAARTTDTVYVRFELVAPEARAVSLAGDFNGWAPDVIQLSRSPNGAWVTTVPLRVGEHRYQFVVNGERWLPDPATEAVDDGFGGRNSVIVVGPKGLVRS